MQAGIPEVTLFIGGLHISNGPALVRTVLGSCVAVCLHDPEAGVGGMNHFMLPEPGNRLQDDGLPSRFGVHAMELLVGGIQKLGGVRKRLRAKLFGGGHVLPVHVVGRPSIGQEVAARNIHFALSYVKLEGIPVVAQDLGGSCARSVFFYTQPGKAFVKRLGETPLTRKNLEAEEVALYNQKGKEPTYGKVILFSA